MQLIPFQASFPKLHEIASVEDFFGEVKQAYRALYEQGLFEQVPASALYIYGISQAGQECTGLIAGIDIKDFLDGRILQHEYTLAAKEEKQLQLLLDRNAAVKPVLLAHPPVECIQEWLDLYSAGQAPFLDVALPNKQERHRLWAVQAPEDIAVLQAMFREHAPISYIADGHHRTSAAVRLYQQMVDNGAEAEPYRTLFAAFFPVPDIEIHDFNRVICSLNGHSPAGFMARLSASCEIVPMAVASRPRHKFEMSMWLRGEWYRLHWKERILLEYADEAVILDAMLLDHKVMSKILGIEDVRNDGRVRYVEGPRGLDGLLKQAEKEKDSVAFGLYPVQMEEVMRVANMGKVLPPKSTWFEPRMKNGLLVQEFLIPQASKSHKHAQNNR